MELLLTSAGIANQSISDALVELLGKPISESNALCIRTATYAMPGGAHAAWRFINGTASTPMCELGWKSLGVLELTALPSMPEEHWMPLVRETDVLLVNGGDALYLAHWMRTSGLTDMFPSLPDTAYIGLSGGSMVMAPEVGEEFIGYGGNPPDQLDRALGLVEFLDLSASRSRRSSREHGGQRGNVGRRIPVPGYAIDDHAAIRITDGTVDIITEGQWTLFTRQPA